MKLNHIYHGSALEVLKTFPDGSIDLCLTDFPYGNNTDYGEYQDNRENLKILIDGVIPEIFRVCKRVLITCGVANIGLYPNPDWILLWVSSAGIGSGKWGFCCWQPILAYGKDPYLENNMGRRPDVIFSNEKAPITDHPCPKPIKLWKSLLLRGSVKESDIILDPFMGSGTTALVAKQLGRDYIGIELNEAYIKLAEERLSREPDPLF